MEADLKKLLNELSVNDKKEEVDLLIQEMLDEI
jgi:hypothetical protein